MSNLKLAHVAVIAGALAITGCSRPTYDDWDSKRGGDRVCVDRQNRRVDDKKCRSYSNSGSGAFMWYYMGYNSGRRAPGYGGYVSGGSYSRPAYAAPSSTRFGGFGSTAHGSSTGG